MRKQRYKKTTALFFLIIFSSELLLPNIVYALTSGPAQPEIQQFQSAGVTDMVDLFSGDLKYNIPLLDVGGYPVNLTYNSGTGMEDEASWVGTGWALNPGAINRTMRGLPDDFNGDKINKTYYRKPFKKTGGEVNLKGTLFGWQKGKANIQLGIYKDNYYGIGASLGAGIGFQLSLNTKTNLNAGLNLLSDVRGGVDISPNFGISTHSEWCKDLNRGSLSGGFDYNTRAGLKDVSLSASFNPSKSNNLITLQSNATTYFGQTYTPSFQSNTRNSGFTFTFDAGGIFTGTYGGVGGKGYTYKEEIVNENNTAAAYGYLYYLKGRKDKSALLDCNREKDGVFIKGTPSIAIAISTQDYFNVTAQTGSQQFRPHFSSNYIVFDKAFNSTTDNTTFGVTVGFGSIFQSGGNFHHTSGNAHTNKWVNGNNYLNVGEPDFNGANLEESAYFKQSGEKNLTDEEYFAKISNEKTSQVVINQTGGTQALSFAKFKHRNNVVSTLSAPLKRLKREKRNANFNYLTADIASKYALDTTINGTNRVSAYRKEKHISEITITDEEGKRMIYGIPVYNTIQKEISFSVKKPANYAESRKIGLVNYTSNDAKTKNGNGRQHLYSKEEIPAYATSFLLTGILSPDYVDRTRNGISDDDVGTAIKFNYRKLPGLYKWRAPYGANKANYDEGFLSDHLDDKANIVYGEKEIWYLDTIQSKTMIAIFQKSARSDGLGVMSENGEKNESFRLQKLDKIILYSKADWIKNGTNATPIKTVHFVYDSLLYAGIPNRVGNDITQGKLTLKKVYFTFGKSTRGQSNPYEFEYDTRLINYDHQFPMNTEPLESQDLYTERQSDRWGTYKQSFYNRIVNNTGTLNNAEFPYVPQENEHTNYSERLLADRLASKWQLSKIITPSGGIISIVYETDDYAYVQNKRAMQMCFIKGIETSGQSDGLIFASKLVIELPQSLTATTSTDRKKEFREKYLAMGGGMYHENIFYKILTNLNNSTGKEEYVHGYAEMDLQATTFPAANLVQLALKKIKPENSDQYYNPISIAAWQMLRTDLPQYAYDNYDNLEVGDGQAAIRSIVQALKNIRELGTPFEKRAAKRKFADAIVLDKSMVRLANPYNKKIGGGSRVKRITISDEWNQMTGAATASYAQEYDYTIKDKNGNPVSSGVASYEPQIGNEENPFHEPVNFTEKVHWTNDKYHFVQKPFCESYFPAASVGYRKVTVTSVGTDNKKETGYIENEFYTAKDFPTLVDYMPLDQKHLENSLIVRLFSSQSIDKVAAAQGFKIELNDMHGKPKSVKTFNKGGDLISSSEYFYQVKDEKAAEKELDNNVDVLFADGNFYKKNIGTDIDLVTDVRESISQSSGDALNISGGVTLIPPFPLFFIPPVPIPLIAFQYSHTSFISSFHCVSSVKVVHKYGILKKVIATQNGAVIETENLLWDAETGEPLLTKTQNEFDKYTYAFNYPAYMVKEYEGMGGAYKNLGAVFNNFQTGTNGNVNAYSTYLFPGDELVSVNGYMKGWVIQSAGNVLRLIDEKGDFISATGAWLLLRSGRRNMMGASTGSIICMKDPRVNGRIILDADKRILDSKAIEFKEEWEMPIPCSDCPSGFEVSQDGTYCYKDTTPIFTPPLYQVCEGDQIGQYTSCGSYIYTSYNTTMTSFERYPINKTNPFWIGFPSHQTTYCGYTPETSSSGYNINKHLISNPDSTASLLRDPAYRGPLNRCGIWVCGSSTPLNRWIGFSRTIQVPTTKTYFIGIAADNQFRFKIDGNIVLQNFTNNQENFKLWHIFPIVLTQGDHIIEMEGLNSGSYAAFGAEIYNNTALEIGAATDYSQLNLIFSTHDLVGQYFETGVYTCPPGYALNTADTPYTCRTTIPRDAFINPYFTGVLGNWRPVVNYVYTVNREQKPGNASQHGGTDIRNSGYFSTYHPFWAFQSNGLTKTGHTDNRWVWNSKSVHYDQKGNEIENVDALNRYSSALFGYTQSLATAVSTNARHNEIAFDGFEDYYFDLQPNFIERCALYRHLDFGFSKQGGIWTNSSGSIVSTTAHTGRYSYALTAATTIIKTAGSTQPYGSSILGYDNIGRYLLLSNELAAGFAPVANKEYLLSFWVKDNQANMNTIQGLQVKINNIDQSVVTRIVPVVEGWKRLELKFIAGTQFKLELIPAGSIHIDDIRLLPNEGQMTSYVYDDQTMRLMAQLDENNFATLYEYDDEGTPIRVKKETERGIMTLKENRQSLRKRN